MEILLDNRQKKIEAEWDELKNKAEKILEALGCSSSAILSISLVDAEEMAYLNREFRHKQGPTNVLSFPQNQGADSGPQSFLLGDVVICTDVAEKDARKMGYADEEMILYLLIHGILHLTGHTHDGEANSKAMEKKVADIFLQLAGHHDAPNGMSG